MLYKNVHFLSYLCCSHLASKSLPPLQMSLDVASIDQSCNPLVSSPPLGWLRCKNTGRWHNSPKVLDWTSLERNVQHIHQDEAGKSVVALYGGKKQPSMESTHPARLQVLQLFKGLLAIQSRPMIFKCMELFTITAVCSVILQWKENCHTCTYNPNTSKGSRSSYFGSA